MRDLRADLGESLFEFFAQERIFFVVRDRRAAVFHIDGAVVDRFFAGASPFASRRVGSEPRGQTERFFAGAEMGVEPVAAHRRRADHTDRFVILPSYFFRCAFFPGMRA